jgi:hypothetical protein
MNLKLWVVILITIAVTAVFLLPFCGVMYQCGCTFLWSGAADQCNIHEAAGPHCPWCVKRNPALMALPFLVIFAGQGFSMYHFKKKYKFGVLELIVVGLLVFLILGVLNGYAFKLMDSYPYFF